MLFVVRQVVAPAWTLPSYLLHPPPASGHFLCPFGTRAEVRNKPPPLASTGHAARTSSHIVPMSNSEALIAASGGSIHEFRKATRKMRWWYESLADYMIANPNATQNEIAAHFGRAVSTISTIVNTDSFTAYFRKRRDEHAEILDAGVRHKLLKVADFALELTLDKLDKKRDTIPLDMLQRTTDSTLKSLGYGVEPRGGTTVNIGAQQPTYVAVPVGVADLEAAREALRRSQQGQVIDVTPNPSKETE